MFSVVIPLFDHRMTIARAVRCALDQTHPPTEVIVVDDGSSDGGANEARAFGDPRVRVEVQPNEGVASARNRGARKARESLVAFLDADDEWAPDHLAVLARLRETFPDAVVYATASLRIDPWGRRRRLRCEPGEHVLDDYFATALRDDPPVNSSSVAVDRATLLAIGGFPVGVRSGEDLLTWARLACRGAVAFSSRHTAVIHVPDMQSDARRQRMRLRTPRTPDLVGEELQKLAAEHPARARSIRAYVGLWHRMRAMMHCELGDRAACLAELSFAARSSGPQLRDVLTATLLAFPARARSEVLFGLRHLRELARDGWA